ncbi:MAG: dihydropteroate synthase DHPS [Roseibacillus sp.]|nr:dihydropteroate synthase DHPS [Roseibacillus sp.]
MSIENLIIIGERINPGFKTSKNMLDCKDLDGIQQLAVSQTVKGAHYLTINVGTAATNDPEFLCEVIRKVQEVTDLPLAFDYPNRSVQEVCLETYDPAKAGGRKPIVNSVSELRMEMLDLIGMKPFQMVLMASERLENGEEIPNTTPEEVHATARRLAEQVMQRGGAMTMDDLFIDVSLGPLSADMEGMTRRAIDSIRLIGADSDLRGVHTVVGLSNFSVLLPKLAVDGSLLKIQLESAFLTMALPLGLDTILGTAGRDYQILDDDNFVNCGFREALELDGFETILRVQQLYRTS